MIEKIIYAADYLTKSHLPASDYVINPYVGCTHGCRYCYACFMKRFTEHQEPWGEFLDVKFCDKPISIDKLKNKSLFMSSVTDCYNPAEEKYCITLGILQQLLSAECELTISTKSKLILRDLDILRQFKNLKVAMSLNTLDDDFRSDMDKASSVRERLNTLETLHSSGIRTVLFISPIFPGITDCKELIEESRGYIDQYWLENLNLRANFKTDIMNYIRDKYNHLYPLYDNIYNKKDMSYWESLGTEMKDYCGDKGVDCINYFYHEKIRK